MTRIQILRGGAFRPAAIVCVAGFFFAGALSHGLADASPETDRLSELAGKGDRAALESLLEMARRRRDADAEYALGIMAYEGRGLERNSKQAFQLMERAAAKGHAEASNILGYFYEHGIGTGMDMTHALAAYRKGAEGGSARAKTNLGWLYEQGTGVAKDASTAADLYKQAADLGLAAAHANLANLYETGNGVAKNPIIAIALYERALAGGVSSAALRLGRLLEERGNLGEATSQYVTAAKAKVPEADLAAGRLLVAAANPRRNVGQGIAWLEQAAAREQLDALQLLARVYDKGEGVPPDPVRAAAFDHPPRPVGPQNPDAQTR